MATSAKAVNNQAAAIALFCDGTILLGKRVTSYKGEKVPFGGNWSLFGGALELGETPLDAALRELDEEAGIQLSEPPDFITKHTTSNKFDFWAYSLSIDYLPQVKLDLSEHTEYGFFNPLRLPEPMDAQIKRIISLSRKHFKLQYTK